MSTRRWRAQERYISAGWCLINSTRPSNSLGGTVATVPYLKKTIMLRSCTNVEGCYFELIPPPWESSQAHCSDDRWGFLPHISYLERGFLLRLMSPQVWRHPSKHTTPWIKPSHSGTHGDTCHSGKSHLRLDRVTKHATKIPISSPPPQQPPPAPARKIRSSSLACGSSPHLRPVITAGRRANLGSCGLVAVEERLGCYFSMCSFSVILEEAPRSGGASSRAASSQPALFLVWRMPPSHGERVWLSNQTKCGPTP